MGHGSGGAGSEAHGRPEPDRDLGRGERVGGLHEDAGGASVASAGSRGQRGAARNDTVASFQGNRNPFIDRPDLVLCAMAGDCGSFYTVTPCRVVDTRNADGPYGGPILSSGALRLFSIPGNCGVPATAEAVSFNVTVVEATGAGNLTLFPGDLAPTTTNTISFAASLTRANNAILKLSGNGVLGVQTFVAGAGQVHLVVDVGGYFD
jgi:hypothetical protein